MTLLNFSGSDWCVPYIRLRHEIFDGHQAFTFLLADYFLPAIMTSLVLIVTFLVRAYGSLRYVHYNQSNGLQANSISLNLKFK